MYHQKIYWMWLFFSVCPEYLLKSVRHSVFPINGVRIWYSSIPPVFFSFQVSAMIFLSSIYPSFFLPNVRQILLYDSICIFWSCCYFQRVYKTIMWIRNKDMDFSFVNRWKYWKIIEKCLITEEMKHWKEYMNEDIRLEEWTILVFVLHSIVNIFFVSKDYNMCEIYYAVTIFHKVIV